MKQFIKHREFDLGYELNPGPNLTKKTFNKLDYSQPNLMKTKFENFIKEPKGKLYQMKYGKEYDVPP